MAALKLYTFGSTPRERISSSSSSARSHCPPAPHAEMAALKLITSGSTPRVRISSSSDSARSHCPPAPRRDGRVESCTRLGSTPRVAHLLQQRQRALPLPDALPPPSCPARRDGRVEADHGVLPARRDGRRRRAPRPRPHLLQQRRRRRTRCEHTLPRRNASSGPTASLRRHGGRHQLRKPKRRGGAKPRSSPASLPPRDRPSAAR